ncbi:protein of unknown function (plasmid) [Streptantibioticus cattleyicolor NRRL 8057 = DSM 46488]|nr:protein of unknown function [Streptantibioticus cattleyicolor NRRL 8057 = DSM 46488]
MGFSSFQWASRLIPGTGTGKRTAVRLHPDERCTGKAGFHGARGENGVRAGKAGRELAAAPVGRTPGASGAPRG